MVHAPDCPYLNERTLPTAAVCSCPVHYAANTLRRYKGLLSGAFRDVGLIWDWLPATASGNPVASAEVRTFMRTVRREQLEGGVLTRRAPLIAQEVMQAIFDGALEQWSACKREGRIMDALAFARDALFYVTLWFTALKASDLLRVRTQRFVDALAPAGGGTCPAVRLDIGITKTAHDPRKARTLLLPDNGTRFCVPSAWRLYKATLVEAGLSVVPGPLFVQFRDSKWQASALACGVAWATARRRFKALTEYCHLTPSITLHSPHGSYPRHLRDRGMRHADICELVDWTLPTYHYYTAGRVVMTLPDALSRYLPQHLRKGLGRKRVTKPVW